MRLDAAILDSAAKAGSEPAISDGPRAVEGAAAAAAVRGSADHGRRLPHVKEFIAAGGDWSAFTWRFDAAFQSVHWTEEEEEALVALPTVLDEKALAVFRSIPPE